MSNIDILLLVRSRRLTHICPILIFALGSIWNTYTNFHWFVARDISISIDYFTLFRWKRLFFLLISVASWQEALPYTFFHCSVTKDISVYYFPFLSNKRQAFLFTHFRCSVTRGFSIYSPSFLCDKKLLCILISIALWQEAFLYTHFHCSVASGLSAYLLPLLGYKRLFCLLAPFYIFSPR